ncbi:uncharacterized protein AB675_11468 [Cyphellophora attinorum]|uniref:Uncharacterized protein n=1 Tax=Cyphellophora attinorum TaxID=1664694 RepID=A0A0N1NZA0_9EURO|nr:uncharacterized protein AB675_11468 [Phialophora attinorum]KPI39915.1 hypothetical protein AB675_11468 [Phialophora attinorum]
MARMLGTFKLHPAYCAKLNEVHSFSFGMGVVKIGSLIDQADTNRFLILTYNRGFNLFRPHARPVANNISIHERVRAARERLADEKRDREVKDREKRNPTLNPLDFRGKFASHKESNDLFHAAFPNHQWGLIVPQGIFPRNDDLQAVVDSAKAQFAERPDLQPTRQELQTIAEEVIPPENDVPDDGTALAQNVNNAERVASQRGHYSVTQLREILSFWARSKAHDGNKLKLGVWREGPGPQLNGPWPIPPDTDVIWIYHNNLRQIFKAYQERLPTDQGNVSDVYRGMTRSFNNGQMSERNNMSAIYSRVVTAANTAAGNPNGGTTQDNRDIEDTEIEAEVDATIRADLQALLDADPPVATAIRLLGRLLHGNGTDRETARVGHFLSSQLDNDLTLRLANQAGIASITPAVDRVNTEQTIAAAAAAMTQAVMAEANAAQDQGNNRNPPPAQPPAVQNPGNAPPNAPDRPRGGANGARGGAAGQHNGTPPPNAPNFPQGRGGGPPNRGGPPYRGNNNSRGDFRGGRGGGGHRGFNGGYRRGGGSDYHMGGNSSNDGGGRRYTR